MNARPLIEDPVVINRTEPITDWSEWEDCRERVVKIVIGALKQKDDAKITMADLPEDLAARFENLTHLHLWGIKGLKTLPALPSGLKCLDVRECPDFEGVPELPAGLETLDLGGCPAVGCLPRRSPAALQRLFLNGCEKIKARHWENFIEDLPSEGLVELDASGCDAVETLDQLPTSVRKVVLKGCRELRDASRLAALGALDHLNLGGCASLRELPDLPPTLRYLVLHGAEGLVRFMDQDIGPYDRGTTEEQNVAKAFHSRRKFGAELAASAHAKLLLMGDGRVGKSTLAKRLQRETLVAAGQAVPPELEPTLDEDPTHKMRFWRWAAPLVLPEAELNSLKERAAARKVALPMDDADRLTGAVRIWDFGGQEIYHNTHRLFAGEGSVFLIVWRDAAPDFAKIDRERPAGCDETEWREWNRQRPLDYWLDYIDSVRPGATVALVCTCCGKGQPRPDWTVRAPRHAGRDLRCFYVDSLDEGCAHHPDYQKLSEWVAEKCGAEAARIGVLQPRFYGAVADQVDEMLRDNDAATAAEREPEHLMLSWADWQDRLVRQHEAAGASRLALEETDVEAITGYLHDAGQIFHLRHGGERAVLVALQWATSLIYEMLKPGGALHRKIVRNGGWIPLAELEQEPHWRLLQSDLQRDRLIHYMEESHVLVRVMDQHESRGGQTLFVANEKWLLPKEDDPKLHALLEAKMKVVREQPGMDSWEKFSFEAATISEFAFRDLMAFLGRRFGRYAVWYRTGLQATPDDARPDWCFRVRWVPEDGEGFLGKVDALLVTRKAHLQPLAEQVETLFAEKDCPLARHGRPVRREAEMADLSGEFILPLAPGQEEVGVSSSGADRDEAAALVGALKAAGIKAQWYLLEECRSDDYARVKAFMEGPLRKAPCLIVLLSDGYLRNDAVNNWYCPWELADAINQWVDGKRSIERTMVVYRSGQKLNSKNLDDAVVPVFKSMAEHFGKAYTDKPVDERMNFAYYNDISLHFTKAWQNGNVGKFYEQRGTLGAYSHILTRADGTKDYAALIAEVRKALGRR